MKVTGTSGDLKSGFAVVMANLNVELEKIKNRTTKGLILSAIEVRRDMEGTPPLIPLDYGNLRASWFILANTKAPATVKQYEVKGGNFTNAETPKKLAEIKSVHAETLTEMRSTLGTIPCGVGMGFGAYYAAAVHEMGASGATAGKQINWSRPGSGAKFFQAALYRNVPKILAIVQANVKIP